MGFNCDSNCPPGNCMCAQDRYAADKCGAHDCNNCPTVAISTDPIGGNTFRVCQAHADALAMLDKQSREVYRITGDTRANRKPLVIYD